MHFEPGQSSFTSLGVIRERGVKTFSIMAAEECEEPIVGVVKLGEKMQTVLTC